MLLTSVILILQEILEAALVLSILLAFSMHRHLSRRWAWFGIGGGVLAACLYARQIGVVSEWFEYVGLEIVNAGIQYGVCLVLLLFAALYYPHDTHTRPGVWYLMMSLILILAIAREGFEILLYAMNFIGDEELWPPVLLGGSLGAGIGASAGALLYYGLVSLNGPVGRRILLGLLALFGGNMAAQGTLLLIQADWLPSGRPIWDTNFLVPEYSVPGQLLYALIGYEASPTALQAGAYVLQVLLMVFLFNLRLVKVKGSSPP